MTVSMQSFAAGLVLAAGSVLVAQPMAPAPAQPPAVAPAPAQQSADDAAARGALRDSALAITKMGGASFKMGYGMLNAPQININGQIDVTMLRNAANPAESPFRAVGRFDMPMVTEPGINVAALEGDRVQWVDDKAKAVFDRPAGPGPDGKETVGTRMVGYVRKSVMMPAIINSQPFTEELRENVAGGDVIKYQMEFLPDEKIGGEDCKVVHVIMKAGSAERKIWLGKADMLPRRYEQFRGGLTRYWQMTDYKPETVSPKDLAIKVPDGYRFDKVDGPPPGPPVGVNPGLPTVPPGGVQIGQLAPEWNLKSTAGQDVVFTKGEPVLVTFGSSMFPQAWVSAKNAEAAAASAAAGKTIKSLSMACREHDTDAAAKAYAASGASGPLLLNADSVAALYNVRGFPSTVLIDGNGKVAAFFEGPVAGPEVAAAVQAMFAAK